MSARYDVIPIELSRVVVDEVDRGDDRSRDNDWPEKSSEAKGSKEGLLLVYAVIPCKVDPPVKGSLLAK